MDNISIPDLDDPINSKAVVDDDQDIIQAQDIESGKDITDQTDIEKEKEKASLAIKESKSNIFEMKKKYIKEGDNMENDEEENGKSAERIVVEKSPKGRYHRFNEELGTGAQKRVYRAYDYDCGREVAWNAINVNFMSEEAIGKIKDEIAIMKKLNHPNIISFFSGFYNEEKKEVVIITEIFSGGSLKQHLAKYGPPRLRVIKFWCKEIVKGLRYLHELEVPVIHRDIKCDNIFINKTTSEVKIGDLGFSCRLKSNEYAKTFSGTIEFCAPEVFFGKYGVKADIYSFGLCVLEMVTNERPYKECEGNIIVMCEKATHQILPSCLEKIRNPRLVEFIKSCLKLENERPSASELLESAFLNDLESEENNYPALNYPPIEKDITTIENSAMTTTSTSKVIPEPSHRKIKDLVAEVAHKSTQALPNVNPNSNTKVYKVSLDVVGLKSKGKYSNIKPCQEYDIVNVTNINNTAKIINKDNKKLSSSSDDFEEISPALRREDNEKYIFEQSVIKRRTTQPNHKKKVNEKPQENQTKRLSDRLEKEIHFCSPFSKPFGKIIDIQLEEEEKSGNIIKILLTKKERIKQKVYKIKFTFNLKKDTCNGVVKELESEISLTEEEKRIIKHKLTNLVRNYTSAIIGLENGAADFPALSEVHDAKQFLYAKNCMSKFVKKYKKILEEAEEIIKASKELADGKTNQGLDDEDQKDFAEKLKSLEEFLKSK